MEFLDGWDFTTGNYADVLNWMHAHENPTYEQAALNWLKENAAVWSAWIPADAAARCRPPWTPTNTRRLA